MSIIKVEDLGKKYTIGHDLNAGGAFRYQSLRESLAHKARGMYQRLRHPLSPNTEYTDLEEFWALKGLNFEIQPSDRVGIIGRNGAGKSTLLKILSRITEPTTGRIEIAGRVASLLEVGTGFHPELTGRENIFLNGSILGMSRADIKRRFDEIVAFGEIERFLDTPVKRYSSGMYVRLAFAVAAHVETEILIVDEVLAVGDSQFQKKCLGKMEEVGKGGRTVLFVSHNMATITGLCSTALLLEAGQLKTSGTVSEVIFDYYGVRGGSISQLEYSDIDSRPGDDFVRLVSANVTNRRGKNVSEVRIDESVVLNMVYSQPSDSGRTVVPAFEVRTAGGIYAFGISPDRASLKSEFGVFRFTGLIPPNFLNEGAYYVGISAYSFEGIVMNHFNEEDALVFNVKDDLEKRPYSYTGPIAGVVRPRFETSLKIIDEEIPL